jgi:hypothetical protein
MSVPHNAQESLSSERTPTLSYSLPFYHAISDKWEHLKKTYPLLSPYIEIGIRKVEGYVKKSNLSRTYLLAVCESLFPFQVTCLLMRWPLVLNPCLKMRWIEKNCSADVVQRTKKTALDTVSPMQCWRQLKVHIDHRCLNLRRRT